ncbi:MAG: hypothetical protein AAF703_10040 [Cyanobacteria bacterium P01_D01_bin.105]
MKKTFFVAILFLNLVSGGAVFNLATQPTLTPQQEHLFAIALEAWAISTATTIEALRDR